MTYHGRIPFSTHAISQGDLDLQPVREAKVRVLNNIPKEPVVPPPPPQVKFNFVDVTFPKSTQKKPTESAAIYYGSTSGNPSKRSNTGKEGNARDQSRYDKENSNTGRAKRNMERDHREYLSRLLKRGMPVWEEVPVEERATKVIGGTNPFRHHPYSSKPSTSNITHRNINKQKSSKVMPAVWEDVQDGFKNSYPLEHSDDLIDTRKESFIEAKDIDLKGRAEKLSQILQNTSQTGLNAAYGTPSFYQSKSPASHELHVGHTIPLDIYGRTHEPAINPTTLSRELYAAEVSQADPTTQEIIDDHVDEDSSQAQEPLQNPVEHLLSQESDPYVQDRHSREDGRLQGDVTDQGRVSRPIIKKIHSGRVDNDAISSISWWPGDKLYREKRKNEEEEKHEKEATKEKKGKRDMSVPPNGSQQRRQVMADQEETEAKVVKSPVRVRHYRPEVVRKYIRDKQSERAEAIKEQQRKQEQEKIKRSERMRELAIKTKQLSQTSRKEDHKLATAGLSQEQNQLEQQLIINWGAQKEWDPEDYTEAVPFQHTRTQLREENLPTGVPLIPSKDRALKSSIQSEVTRDASHAAVVSPKKDKHERTYAKKKNKKDGKKKKRQSVSDSEAISDIVSRTVEECERKVKSSSVSVESLSSLSSYSCSSSDAESKSSMSQSESLSSGLDVTPKERAVALGQLAQKLTSRVTQETGSFTQREKHKEDTPGVLQKKMSSNKGKQSIRGSSTGANILSDPRASLSLSQIETMSVEELIAKMTAMLPNKSINERKSNAPQNDLQSKSINICEKQNFEENVQARRKNQDISRKQSQDASMRESLERVVTEQLPNLVVPDVPKLKLSNTEKNLQKPWKSAPEDLSTLPGQNMMESVQYLKSQPGEGKQVYVEMTPSHKLQHRHVLPQSERHLAGQQHSQPQMFSKTYKNYVITPRNKYEHAARVIQAAYRGYRVRKVTNSLINRQPGKDTHEAKYCRGLSNITQVGVSPEPKKVFRNSGIVIGEGSKISQEVLSKEGKEQGTNWREIQSNLEQGAFKLCKESYYVPQSSDLPEWIKPYFMLSETGNVSNFLEAHMNKTEAGMGKRAENRSSSNVISQSPECDGGFLNHPHLISEKSMHDVTLTEGPLSEIEKETVSYFDKETQTSNNKYLDTKDKQKFEQVRQDFVDLKKFSKRKGQIFQEKGVTNHAVESLEMSSKRALDSSQLGFSQKEHEEIEESPLEEVQGRENSLQVTENETFESGSTEPNLTLEEGPLFETSGILDTSNASSSVAVEGVSAPHELLGEGVHLGPASLRLRLNAELTYQDTLGKALNHLHNVEQLNILSRSRQEAMALSQSLSLQQQKMELTTLSKNENDAKIQEEEAKRRDDYERRLKERLKQQEEALQKVEKIEKEARSRFAELEREVRSKAEKVIAQAAERVPQPSIAQSDVIAAAAVAAVGATISQWKQLRPARCHDSHGSIMLSDGSLSPKISSDQIASSSLRPSNDKSQSEICSARSLSREQRSTNDISSSFVSERIDKSLSKSLVTEILPSGDSTSKKTSEVISDVKSSLNSVPENSESSVPTRSENMNVDKLSIKSRGGHFKEFNTVSISQGTSVSEKIESIPSSKAKFSSGEVASASNLEAEDSSSDKKSETVTEAISKDDTSGTTRSSEVKSLSSALPHSPKLKSYSSKDHRKYQVNEIIPSKKIHGSSLGSSSKSKVKDRKKEEGDASCIYSDSFEVDSNSEDSNSSHLQSREQGTHGDLALVVSSGNILNDIGYKPSTLTGGEVTAPMSGVGGEGALSVTVSVVESLLKEEEVHHQHQKTLLKLQEQSLVEEAKWKLTTLQSEGGPGMRRRQRAIVLQLREQKAHLKRLRETQNIGAQQRRLMLLQLHHLLAATTSLSGYSSKGYLTASRGHSPNPASPRLTPRLMEMLSSSSSDAPDDVTFSLLMRGRDSDSSSPSESGGAREKRRCHSEDRLKISSGRHHEKRWTAEIEALQQQILHEDKEILRLKSKSPYDIPDKDSVKLKRKGDFIGKRSRDKREKNSGSVSPLSVLVHGNRTPLDNMVPADNVAATTRYSQSSIPEEGSETVSHSDAASSVSEQEGLTSISHRTGNSKSNDISLSKRVPSFGGSEREISETRTSNPKMISSELESDIQEEYSDSKVSENCSSAKTVSSGETSRSVEERYIHDNSERISKSSEESNAVESEVYEMSSKSQESSIRTKLSTNESVKSGWNKPESVIPEDMTNNFKTRTTSNSSSWHSTDTKVDTGTRSSDSKSSEGKSLNQKSSSRGLPLPLKVPLSPRSLHRQHRRYSSESDDSFTLSQTETASDISDGEGKLLALKEELAMRRAEAERLKKEKRRLRRERLASQERALRQQISTYDAYIQHARMELEKESKELKQVSMVRPLIKKPQVAETKKSRLSESVTSPEKSDVSDVSLVSEGSKSDQSSISRPQETSIKEKGHVRPEEVIKLQESYLEQVGEALPKDQDVASSSSAKDGETEEKSSSSKEVTLSETVKSQRENESEKTSYSSSISENSNEESVSEHLQDDSSIKSLSQESSVESDCTHSQASSTETIVHSPQKLDPSQKDEVGVSVSEVNAALLEVLKGNEKDHFGGISKTGAGDMTIKVEGEKLEIFIPTSGFNSSEAEELVEGNMNTSAEQSISEEEFYDNFQETEIENSSEKTDPHNVVHPLAIEDKVIEETDESNSFISENKVFSLKSELASETNSPTSLTVEAKEISSGTECKIRPPTLDRQRLVDDISNNILAIMMKDTSQLFTNIVKDKVNISKAPEVMGHAEAVMESIVPELRGEALEPKKDAGLHGQHSCSTVPREEASGSKPSCNSKSLILQRVNELIGESGPGSPHLASLSSPRSVDVQITFDLSPENSPSISPTVAKATKAEADEVEMSKGTPPLLPGEGITISDATIALEEQENDSLSPSHDVVKAEEYKLDTETLTTRLLNLASAPELDLEARLGQLNENTEFSVEGIEGDWFDDDFWTSSDNRKKQQQLKAEEERITAEIARLEELQHLQQKYPGLVIREVPNKPPPPYTPPQVTSPPSPGSSPTPAKPPAYTNPPTSPTLPEAQPMSPIHSSSISHRLSKADQRKLAAHITQVVPITEEEALPIINNALDTLYEAWQNNIDPGDIPPPAHTTFAKAFSFSSFNDEDMQEDERISIRAFHLLLFCLARELLSVPYKLQHATQPPPWMKQVLPQARMLGMVHAKSRAGLFSHITEQVKVLFGWKPPLQKESLMIRWAQKHRDLVDQVLVKELQAEEASWTNYDDDEAAVKTKVASEILDTLLSETLSLVSGILVKKLGYLAH